VRLWFYDHLAVWADRVGDWVSMPFYRLARWSYERWEAQR